MFDTLSVPRSHIDGLLIVYVLSNVFMCFREAKAIPLKLPNHHAKACETATRVKLGKALLTLLILRQIRVKLGKVLLSLLILRHPLHECLIQI